MDVEKFKADIDTLTLNLNLDNKIIRQLKDKLIELYKRNQIKINHSIMELIVAIHLLKYGYEDVDVEKELDKVLRCDVYGKKGDGDIIVEIETGFIPPEYALEPLTYYKARLASKIARYSKFASKFALAVPQYCILPLHELFIKPIKDRIEEEILEVKRTCDLYYTNPPIDYKEIQYGRLHSIFILDIDNRLVLEFDPWSYKDIVYPFIKEFNI